MEEVANKIYTRKGDEGYSSLNGKDVIKKSDRIFSVLGTLDELNSHIGIMIPYPRDKTFDWIQDTLIHIGSVLSGHRNDNDFDFEGRTILLEQRIDINQQGEKPITGFIKPRHQCHVARAVCRRFERKLVKIQHLSISPILMFVNRLSDYLFILGTYTQMKLEKIQ